MTTVRCAVTVASHSLWSMTTIFRDIGGRLRHARALILLTALSLALAGCGLFSSREPLEWELVFPAGDCHCADGSPFSFWERRADPAKVVFFLNGGGVCWDATTCAFTGERGESDAYAWNLSGVDPENRSGLFDTTDGDNPFAEYSFLYVSPCTGDAHLGNKTQKYGPALTVEHRGYANGTAALAYLAEHYPDAAQVVVIGKTAGSAAAPIYGGLVADKLPQAKVVVLGGQSGAWPDNPDFNTQVLGTRWGAFDAAPTWATDGRGVRDWGVPTFWIQAARHASDLVLARFDFAYDPSATAELTQWLHSSPPDLLAEIDRNEAAIEAAGVTLHSYTAPGARHQIFEDLFYDVDVNGVALTDWLDTLVTKEPPKDVRCQECGP